MILFCSAHSSRVMQMRRLDRRDPVSAIGRHTIWVLFLALAPLLLPLSASAPPGTSSAAIKISLFITIPIESAAESPLAVPKSSSTPCAAALKQGA